MIEPLQTSIQVWLKARRHRSLKQLAEECGLNYGTIRNMADGKAVPNGETVLRVLLVTEPVESVHSFVQTHLPHLAPYTKSLSDFGGSVGQRFPVTRRHCEIILHLSFGPCSLEQLILRFGAGSSAALDDLLAADLVQKSDEGFRLSQDDIYFASQAFAVELSRILLDNLNINLKGNLILAHSASLSIEAVRDAYRILDKAQNDILRLVKDPKNLGEERIAVSLAMTMF